MGNWMGLVQNGGWVDLIACLERQVVAGLRLGIMEAMGLALQFSRLGLMVQSYIWKECWVLGKNCSVDKQTCKMQGKSKYKTRCGKYKRLGDGLQCDCIADDGVTHDFYFCNEPVPMKWIQKGMCPMHCHLLHMFENFEDVGHHCKWTTFS